MTTLANSCDSDFPLDNVGQRCLVLQEIVSHYFAYLCTSSEFFFLDLSLWALAFQIVYIKLGLHKSFFKVAPLVKYVFRTTATDPAHRYWPATVLGTSHLATWTRFYVMHGECLGRSNTPMLTRVLLVHDCGVITCLADRLIMDGWE